MEKEKTTTLGINSNLKDELKLQAVMNGVSLVDLTNTVIKKAIEDKDLMEKSVKELKNGLG